MYCISPTCVIIHVYLLTPPPPSSSPRHHNRSGRCGSLEAEADTGPGWGRRLTSARTAAHFLCSAFCSLSTMITDF
ncbi:hypothetical protein E2C01_070612 [Portunus trituberculatus]|uniref:Uncharacterized protein n=1 Tax=Portunus trituberculatus TaxID=210409 RepID=A0A5B7I232_PORTR|nr:hypothetical protein [Portunus trituberculatus]